MDTTRFATHVASSISYEQRAGALASDRNIGPYERYFKWGLDRAAGITLSILVLPVAAVLAVYVLIRVGRPVLDRERRVGKNGRIFRMNRFRTLRVASYSDADYESQILPAGRFLRRWSLDELPQLWNVAIGQMSLVGPRPERPEIVNDYEPWEHRRHQVRPGATGLWQVTARGDGRHMHEHVEIDLQYIDRLSFLYDLRILARTVGVVLRRREKPSAVPTVVLPRRTWREAAYLAVKRVGDATVAAASLIVLSPFMLAVAIAVKLDSPGPVLFRQIRVGHYGQLFRVVKFRTMQDGASDDRHRRHYEALASGDPSGSIRLRRDERVTRVGRVLRRYSLDELPNLWNVLAGQMSLVGPRPLVPYELDLHSEAQRRRLDAKPGITGMAQIEGRGDITMEDRVRYDLEYVDRRSVLFDLRVLLRTVGAVLTTRGD